MAVQLPSIYFNFDESTLVLEIQMPDRYDEISDFQAEHFDFVSSTSTFVFRNCKLKDLTTNASVVLDNCTFRTVKAAGSVFCKNGTKVTSTISGVKVALDTSCHVQKIEGAYAVYIGGNDSLDLIPQIPPYCHLYTNCFWPQDPGHKPNSQTPLNGLFLSSSKEREERQLKLQGESPAEHLNPEDPSVT